MEPRSAPSETKCLLGYLSLDASVLGLPCPSLAPMLRQASHELRLPTRGRGLYEFTSEVTAWLSRNKCQTGPGHPAPAAHVGLTVGSKVGKCRPSTSRTDLERFFSRLDPDGDSIFIHTAEGEDDMPAHIRTALTTVNLSIPMNQRSSRAQT